MVIRDEHTPPQETPTDRELIRSFQENGAPAAFDELIRRHSGKAFQIAVGFLGSREDAEEVVQDAFVRIYRSLPRFRGDAEFSTWMYRIVMNLCNNRYRWNKVRGAGRLRSLDEPLESQGGDEPLKLEIPDNRLAPDKQVDYTEMRDRLEAAMNALPEAYRQAVLLRNVHDLDYDQIAEMLHCAVGTVKSRINRGRELLREALKL